MMDDSIYWREIPDVPLWEDLGINEDIERITFWIIQIVFCLAEICSEISAKVSGNETKFQVW